MIDRRGMIRYIDIHDKDDRPDNDVLREALAQIEAGEAVTAQAGGNTVPVEPSAADGVFYEPPEESAIPRGEIVLYCAYWCKDCRKARAWLNERGLSYVEVDIDSNVEARRQVRAWSSGKLITPIIEFDGAVILDYDPVKLEEALQKRLG